MWRGEIHTRVVHELDGMRKWTHEDIFWLFSNQRCDTSKVAYTREQCVKAASSAVVEPDALEEALACFFACQIKGEKDMYI